MTETASESRKSASHWKTQIELAEKERRNWLKRGETICRRFRDERGAAAGKSDEASVASLSSKMNLFWSNVETLKPAVYSKAPQPIVERRFLDKDEIGKVASQILERALRYELPSSGFHHAMKLCRDDYLLVGRGQVWVRYNPKFGEPISPEPASDDDAEGDESGENDDKSEEKREKSVDEQEHELLSESLAIDYVHWQDFYTSHARTWTEVEWVAKRAFMGRDALIEKFGKKIGKAIPLDHQPESYPDKGSVSASASASALDDKEGSKATVYEIWDKTDKEVYFIAKEYDEFCMEPQDDPLRLEEFFPCPRPVSATTTNDTLFPVPDYAETQDQYVQIDTLTQRIDILTGACKIAGAYDAAHPALKRIFEEAKEPDLIPVDQWAMYAERGGLKGAIDLVPIEAIASTLQMLIQVRTQIIADLDRVTGIWDIMRGTSDARETMGAQRLKQNNGMGRLQDRQDEFARFCREIICIMGEIIAEHYDPMTLIDVSGALYDEGLIPPAPPPMPQPPMPPMMGHNGGPSMMAQPPQQTGAMPPAPGGAGEQPGIPPPGPSPMPPPAMGMPINPAIQQQQTLQAVAQAINLLRQDKTRGFRIDIETDSTIQGDAQEEKSARIEFISGVTDFIEKAGQMTAAYPQAAPLLAKMLMFAVRGFRVGRDLESAIEDFADKAEADAREKAMNPQQKPSPEEIKANTEMAKSQAEITRAGIEAKSEEANSQMTFKIKELEFEMAKFQAQADAQRLQMESQFNMARHEARMKELALQAATKGEHMSNGAANVQ